jgi:hypothetical protein
MGAGKPYHIERVQRRRREEGGGRREKKAYTE